ncbi:MAG: protein kinase, partial [Deltaproteobacteria bacterium]|nr:protein kinase [Deltaproteobacteria bacterium]
MQALVPGAIVGSYTIGAELGRGAMGSIFEGLHRVTGVRRAIKVVRSDFAIAPGYRERFVREASIATQLRHPNIVETYDPIIDGAVLALPMELLHGELLSAYIATRTRLDVVETARLLLPIGGALAAIHARGYVHRDVKPHNIMLVEVGGVRVAKLLDFGTARDISGHQRSTLTGEIVGSPAYMSPEQALGLRDIDARADVYSLGVTLYHALTGRRPHVSDSEGSPIDKLVQRVRVLRPSELVADIPREIESVILRALAWDRGERWPDMPSMLSAFDAAMPSRAPHAVAVSSAPLPSTGPTTSPMGRIELEDVAPALVSTPRASTETIQGSAFARSGREPVSGVATTLPAPVGTARASVRPRAIEPTRPSMRADLARDVRDVPSPRPLAVGVASALPATVSVPPITGVDASLATVVSRRAPLIGGLLLGVVVLGLAAGAGLAFVLRPSESSPPPLPLDAAPRPAVAESTVVPEPTSAPPA